MPVIPNIIHIPKQVLELTDDNGREEKLQVYREEEDGNEYLFAEQNTDTLMRLHWIYDEIPLTTDERDYRTANNIIKENISGIMLLFTQNEVGVAGGYVKLASIFKPNQVKNWFIFAGGSEVTHEMAYSLFTDTIGLPTSIYSDFLEDELMTAKTKYVVKAKLRDWSDYLKDALKANGIYRIVRDMEDMEAYEKNYNGIWGFVFRPFKKSPEVVRELYTDAVLSAWSEYRRAIARMLAIYGGGTEAISLFAQFAMLNRYPLEGMFQGLGEVNQYSIREEYKHFMGNAEVFRKFISENPDIWDDELKSEIYQAIRDIVDYEEKMVRKLKHPYITDEEAINYIHYQADAVLKEFGMKPNWNQTTHTFQYMEEITSIVVADFFNRNVTQYAKRINGSKAELREKYRLRKLERGASTSA